MRKVFFIVFSLFLLASCGSTSQVGTENTISVSGSGFSLQIPSNWSYSGVTSELPSPAQGEIVLWAVSPNKKYNFSHNIIILKDSLDVIGSSREYSEINNKATQKKYSEYTFVQAGDVIFNDSDEGKYYVFDAKYNSQTQKLRFIQTAKMCGLTAYMLHATVSLDTDPSNYIALFKTFSCK